MGNLKCVITGRLLFCNRPVILKRGQKNELLLNLIFPDYPDRNGGADENSTKEKETENSVSQSGCSYTPVMVHQDRQRLNPNYIFVNGYAGFISER